MLRQVRHRIRGVSMSTLLTAILFVGWTGVVVPPTVKVEPANGSRMQAGPGEVVTVVFRVTNLEEVERTYSSKITLPEGWRLIAPQRNIVVPPFATDVRLLSIHVPYDAPPAVYNVTYTAQNIANPLDSGKSTITVTVGSVSRIEVQLLKTPRFLMAGQRGEVEGYVVNKGNVNLTTTVAAHAPAEFVLETNSLTLAVPAQSVVPFSFSVAVRKDLPTHKDGRIRFSASPIEDESLMTSTSAIVRLFPTGRRRRSANTPARLTFRSAGDERGTGGQVSLEGSGPFASGILDLEVTAPDLQRRSIYGRRSVYSARYESEQLDLLLGDNLYALSPLTEVGRFGLGAGARSRVGRFDLNGFVHQVRYSLPDDQQAGLSVSYRASPKARIGGNVFHRRGLYDGDVFSLQTGFQKDDLNAADVECGVDSNGGVRAPSCFLAASLGWPGMSFNIRALKTQPDFPGYARDLTSISANVVASLKPWLRFEGAVQGQDLGLFGGFSRQYTVSRVGTVLSGRRDKFPAYLLVYLQNRRLTLRGTGDPTSQQDAIKLRTGYNWHKLGVSGGVEKGWTTMGTLEDGFQRAEIELQLLPHSAYNLTAAAEYVSGVSELWGGDQRQWLMNTSVNLQFGQHTRGLLQISSSLNRGDRRHTYQYGRAQLDHEFKWGHRAGIKAQHGRFVGLGHIAATDFTASYSIPVGLPNRLTSNSRKVTGRVFDVDTGRGVSGVVVFLGSDATITGKNGRFDLNLPEAAKSYLRIDRVSAGVDRVPVRPMPVEVDGVNVDPGEVNIPLALSGNVVGSVSYSKATAGPAADRDPDRYTSRFLLELSSDVRRFRTLTDREGRFSFAEVPPGPYTVSVLNAKLPAHYQLEKESIPVIVQGGGETTVDFAIVASKRALRVIDSGVIELDRKAQPSETTSNPVETTPTSPAWEPGGLDRTRGGYTIVVTSELSRPAAKAIASATASRISETVDIFATTVYGERRFRVGVGQFRSFWQAVRQLRSLGDQLPEDSWVAKITRGM